MKRVVFLTLILTPLVLSITACSGESKAETTTTATATSEAPALPSDVADVAAINTAAVETAAAATASTSAFEATGEFISPVRSELSPKLPGRVAKLYVDEGSRVQRGQPVLLLESDYARIHLQSAEAEAARAKAARDEAARDLERKKGLSAKDSIPRATLDRSQAVYEQANAARSEERRVGEEWRSRSAQQYG